MTKISSLSASFSATSVKSARKSRRNASFVKCLIKPPAKKSQNKSSHPASGEMVIAAISALCKRGGSSLFAIKKCIASTYDIDIEKQAIFIKEYLRTAVGAGILIQTAGRGASGSFKLPNNNSGPSETKSERDHAEQEIAKTGAEKLIRKKSAQASRKAGASKKTGVKKLVEQSPKKTSSETTQTRNPTTR